MEKRKKAKKRFSALTSFLLALALLTGTLGALPAECFAAQPEKAAFHSTYGFRLGSSAKMELQFRDKLEKNYKVNGNTYYGSQTDLSRQLRDQMVKRSDQVVLRLATDRRGLTGRSNSAAQAREELFLGLLNDATAQRNSVSARDGDYQRCAVCGRQQKRGLLLPGDLLRLGLLHHRRRGAVGGSVRAEVCAPGRPKQNERL